MADMEEDISEVQVVEAEQVGALSQQGWRLIKVVSSQGVETLTKNYPYQTSPGSYPSTCPYSEQAVIQRSKFVMGKPSVILSKELQSRLDEVQRLFEKECTDHAKAKSNLSELGNDVTKKAGEIRLLTNDLSAMKEKHAKLGADYQKLHEDFEKLKTATLQTLVKLPGGNEVSIDDAGKMVKAGEILGGTDDIPF